MNLVQIKKKLVLSLLTLMLTLGIWNSQAGLRAELLFDQSKTLQASWSESPETLTRENWLAAGEDVYASISLNEKNGEYIHQYGLLLERQRALLGASDSAPVTQEILTNAIEVHRLGIRQQPSNPYGWAYFARVKMLAGQFDNEFDLALERIHTLAPWDRELQKMVASIAQSYWSNLSQNGSTYTVRILENALSTPELDSQTVATLQQGEHFLTQICPLLNQTTITTTSQAACQ